MAHLSIRVLGPFQVSFDGEPVSGFASDKVRALLAYLALSPDRPQRREALAGLLWPEFPERSARSSLRNALANLRQVIRDRDTSPPFLHSTRQTIQFNGQSDYWLDAVAFEDLLAPVQPTGEQLEQATSLVRGLFLEGFTLADAAPFEGWLLLRREHSSRLMVKALHSLAAIYEGRGAHEQALAHARRRVELEPWQEGGQRQLMRLLARSGHRSQALARYEKLCRSLQEELGAEPTAETRALYEAILSGKLAQEPALRPGPPVPVWNLPASPTPFFGRVDELATLEAKLAEPDTRLVTLTGLGGSGKTRLALEVGSRLAERDRQALAGQSPLTFPHGIVFVPLAALDSIEGLVAVLADALGLRLEGGQEQLLESLRRKQLLLILDNLEQLLAEVGFLAQIVRIAPGVKIMATSRERLQVQGEHILPLGGLHYPEHDLMPGAVDLDAGLAAYPALQLLTEAVRRVRSPFSPSSADLPVMLDICRLVDGLPLALELAASWADTLSLNDILVEARRSLDFWQVDWPDLPERQRSIRAVFDVSWRRLNLAEQAMFSSLTVFRGGCTREAAGQVVAGTAAIPRLLAALVRKSFLQYDQARDRYQIHELLRQYGAEKLAHEPARETEARDRHSAHYAGVLQHWETELRGRRRQAALSRLEADRENIRAAWHRAAEQGQVERLDRAMDGLAQFFWSRGPFRDGKRAFRMAVDSLAAAASQKLAPSANGNVLPVPSAAVGRRAEGLRVLARALAWESNFSLLRGDKDLARDLQQQSLTLLDGPGMAEQDTRREKALLFNLMGNTVLMSDFERGRHCYERGLELYRELGDRRGTANTLENLGETAEFTGSDCEARRFFEESLAIHQSLDLPLDIARLGSHLAEVALRQGQFEKAERLAHESFARCRELKGRTTTAYCVLTWGQSLEKLGRFEQALAPLEECLAIHSDLGNPNWVGLAQTALCSVKLHLGQYEQARTHAQTALARVRKARTPFRVGHALLMFGSVALAEEAHTEAQQLLQESVAVFREIGTPADLGWAIAVSSYAVRSLGQVSRAQRYLCEALRILTEIRNVAALLYVLPAAALLLADAGQSAGSNRERAVELYTLALRYPFVAKSRWFADVAGNQLAAVAATLPAERVAVLEESGQSLDLETTAAELLTELCR